MSKNLTGSRLSLDYFMIHLRIQNVVTFERIEEEFGSTVRHIVEGETKVLIILEF